VRFESFFDDGYVLRERGDFLLKSRDSSIKRLEVNHQMGIWVHGQFQFRPFRNFAPNRF
jgi:hypothetical protein